MNEQELRAYAVRGLSARLAELDEERSRIVVLLGQWGEAAATPTGRPRARRVPHERDRIEPAETLSAGADAPAPPVAAAEPEVARVLPRRNRVQSRPPEGEQVPALPPMPRLVKARAS